MYLKNHLRRAILIFFSIKINKKGIKLQQAESEFRWKQLTTNRRESSLLFTLRIGKRLSNLITLRNFGGMLLWEVNTVQHFAFTENLHIENSSLLPLVLNNIYSFNIVYSFGWMLSKVWETLFQFMPSFNINYWIMKQVFLKKVLCWKNMEIVENHFHEYYVYQWHQ